MMKAPSLAVPIVLLAGVWLAGCSKPDDVRVPVQGTVFVGGKPATYGAVILIPDASKGNTSKHEPRGKIEADGKFTVQTTTQNGAPAGPYKVGVTVTEPPDPKNPYVVLKSLIDAKYNDPETSGLSLEVVPSAKAGAYDLKLAPN